jgi:hypothetical protein
MSRVHIDYELIKETSDIVEYSVMSPDFNDKFELEKIGILIIDKINRIYTFHPHNKWSGENVMPPYVYALPEEERIKLVNTRYANARFGAWTARIDRMAKMLMEKE